MVSVDVVIVGAGLAGLTAASALARAGASTVVLEARDRVGGRTLSRQVGSTVFDLGGQWLGPGQLRLNRLVRELGLRTFPTHDEGTKVMDVDGRLSTYTGTIPSLPLLQLLQMQLAMTVVDRYSARVPAEQPWQLPRAAHWDAITVDAWRRRFIRNPAVRGVMDVAVRTVFGAEAAELSLLYFLAYLNAGGGMMRLVEIRNGAQQDRFVDGAQAVSKQLAAALGEGVVLRAAARRIEHSGDGVSVFTDSGAWHGRYAVVAVPPLLAGRIVYDPALPAPRDALTQRFPMGATIKCIALYERAFWRERGFSGEAICSGGPVTVVFDNTSHDGTQPALLAFIVGQAARDWSARPAAERRRAVLQAYVRFFGAEAEHAIDYFEQDWSAEPWSGGCPVGVMAPGTLSQLGPTLRQPVGRIHWAGTETAVEWTGYLEGAIESGERAAREVVARL